MSLIRQLWLAVTAIMLLAFAGTFLVTTAAARQYLGEQLLVKNIDNATSLALSISQMEKDPVTIELLIAAQFDAGHYRLIRLTDPSGKLLVERRNAAAVRGVPTAFVAAVRMRIKPGVAQVQDGWKQYGTLTVESHDQYAYEALWKGTLKLLVWFAVAALLVDFIGSTLLRRILAPLDGVMAQAEAIGGRQFITQNEPWTFEFRRLVRAMNALSRRVQTMLEGESRRVEQLRVQAQIDPVTGLRNRETFIATLEDALLRDDRGAAGALLIVRIGNLQQFNKLIGHVATDQMLHRVGDKLTRAATGHEAWSIGRLSGTDFAVLAPGEAEPAALAGTLAEQARLATQHGEGGPAASITVGCTSYVHGESRAAVLARADGALAQAEQTGALVICVQDGLTGTAALPTDLPSWRSALVSAMHSPGVQLGRYPVKARDGILLHHEAPARLKIGEEWQPAARFIAWASRLDLLPQLETLVVASALRQIAGQGIATSVNISPDSVCAPGFRAALARQLRQSPRHARQLWLEVHEYGALHHLQEFRRFCQTLKPLGCKLGLKHAGQQFVRIAELHDLGLDYLKIDGSIIQSAQDDADHQAFLRSLCTVAHTVGLTTIAAGVRDLSEMEPLAALGIDAFTGPAIQD